MNPAIRSVAKCLTIEPAVGAIVAEEKPIVNPAHHPEFASVRHIRATVVVVSRICRQADSGLCACVVIDQGGRDGAQSG